MSHALSSRALLLCLAGAGLAALVTGWRVALSPDDALAGAARAREADRRRSAFSKSTVPRSCEETEKMRFTNPQDDTTEDDGLS